MNIGVSGASGFIGTRVVDLALRRGHEVIAFSRRPERKIPGCTMRPFSLEAPPDLGGCEAFIHLAGEPVVGLWTAARKRRIAQSRILGTRRVSEAFAATASPPEVLVAASAIGFYGDAGEQPLTEVSPPGTGFLSETVQAWEAEALSVPKARVVRLRTGIVLGNGGGALAAMRPMFRAGLGAQIGDGHQWVSWIHLEDLASLALFAAENLEVSGAVNGTAPWPVRNGEWTRTLAGALHRRARLRLPGFAVRLLGEFSHELLDSKRVLPEAATAHGFPYHFPELAPALQNLLG